MLALWKTIKQLRTNVTKDSDKKAHPRLDFVG